MTDKIMKIDTLSNDELYQKRNNKDRTSRYYCSCKYKKSMRKNKAVRELDIGRELDKIQGYRI